MKQHSKPDKRTSNALKSRLIACVPKTWMDEALSGPKSVLPTERSGRWNCDDIEHLLNRIRERMELCQ